MLDYTESDAENIIYVCHIYINIFYLIYKIYIH